MREFRILNFLAVLTVLIATLNACANDLTTLTRDGRVSAAIQLPDTETFSGNYLAGRFAQRQKDWSAAEQFTKIVLNHDPGNLLLQQRAFLLSLGAGNYTEARTLADTIVASGTNNEIVNIFIAADEFAQENNDTALDYIHRLPDANFGQYTKPILSAWILAAQNKYDLALKKLSEKPRSPDAAYAFHSGMIKEMKGDILGAANDYKDTMAKGLTLHSSIIISGFFQKNDRADIAEIIYSGLGRLYPFNPFIATLTHIKNGHDTLNAASDIRTPKNGAGLALLDLAAVLYEKKSYDSALIYARIAERLLPNSDFVAMLRGDIDTTYQRYADAEKLYTTVPETSPLFWLAQSRRIDIYSTTQQYTEAIDLLRPLAARPDFKINALVATGNIYREQKDFNRALTAYDEAITMIGTPDDGDWPLLFARGVTLEHLNNWERAEKDLLQATRFRPDNTAILDHLGDAYWKAGHHKEARTIWLRAHDISKDANFKEKMQAKIEHSNAPAEHAPPAAAVAQTDAKL